MHPSLVFSFAKCLQIFKILSPGNTLLPDVHYRTTCGRSRSKRMGEGWDQDMGDAVEASFGMGTWL